MRDKGITHKKWRTAEGKERGGAPIGSSAVHRLLRERIYEGYIENKITGEVFQGQHAPILSTELFNAVQERLKENTSGKAGEGSQKISNLLTGKLFTAGGQLFINQATSRNHKVIKRYYAVKGVYLSTPQMDGVIYSIIKDVLNADLHPLGKNISLCLKQIHFEKMEYFKRQEFIKTIVDRVIYTKHKMTVFIKISSKAILYPFMESAYINQNNNPLGDIIINRENNLITIEREVYFDKGISSNKYNAGKTGFITIAENNHLMVRAFAYAWKYKTLYESGLSAKNIAKKEKASLRTIYKYLNLAYLSPTIVNTLLSGKKTVPLRDLYDLASSSQIFSEQEALFLKY